MRKVTTINLNGRAYQLEDAAYEALHTYLEKSARALHANPDKTEILADLEQAVADKCERYLKQNKNVVTTDEITIVLQEIGQVEDDEDQPAAAATSDAERPRRLFRIPEGSILYGVCNGIAAYFGADPSLVRVAFVLLTLLTGGFWLVLYIVLAVFAPVAETEEDLAAAYGRPITAREIVERAKDHASSASGLDQFVQICMRLIRIAARLSQAVLSVALAVFSAIMVWALWVVGFGDLGLPAQLRSIATWEIALAVIVGYLLVAIPLFALLQLMGRLASSKTRTTATKLWNGAIAAVWVGALAVGMGLISVHASTVRNYIAANGGYVDIHGNHICADKNRCGDGRFDYGPQPDLPGRPFLPMMR